MKRTIFNVLKNIKSSCYAGGHISHTKYNCKYHIVFAPKYRRMVAYGKLKEDIVKILSALCKRKGVKIVQAEICPDHVHMQ